MCAAVVVVVVVDAVALYYNLNICKLSERYEMHP